MLLLSYFGVAAGPRGLRGATHFEELSAVAAQNYLGGAEGGAKAYHFGFPRRLHLKGFVDALDDLCLQLGEGDGATRPPAAQRKNTLEEN